MRSRLNRKVWLVVLPLALIAACILGLWFFTSPVRLITLCFKGMRKLPWPPGSCQMDHQQSWPSAVRQ